MAPIHFGNVIIGNDVSVCYFQGRRRKLYICGKYFSYRVVRLCILLIGHLTILPFQLCVVSAVFLIHDKLDEGTFIAMKELVDAVIVLAAVELAVRLKSFLWGASYVDKIHSYDRFSYEQQGECQEM